MTALLLAVLLGQTSQVRVCDPSVSPARCAAVDSSGNLKTVGTATISGTTTANQGTAAGPASSWPVEQTDGVNVLGTDTHPTRMDPTGTTPQPVTAVSLPLPTGAAQEAGGNLATIAAQQTATAKVQVTNLPRTLGGALLAQPPPGYLQPVVDAVVLSAVQQVSAQLAANAATLPPPPPAPRNPFLPRCNAVRTTGCQP